MVMRFMADKDAVVETVMTGLFLTESVAISREWSLVEEEEKITERRNTCWSVCGSDTR